MNNDFLLKFSYLTTLTYLKHKYGKSGFFESSNILFEDLAIEISASFFYKDETGKIQFSQNNGFSNFNNLSTSDQEFLIYKTIVEKVDNFIKI
ncbi:MAG: hypothetical protein IPH62_04395 [Ignavibacteriae bacterium]|nr:hypothetical protein [Ignavibacteriota bacterium]